MSTLPLRSTAATLAVAALLVLSGCGGDAQPGGMGGMPASSTGASATPAAAGTPASGEHNDADVMFAQGMVPHHEQAVQMSDLLLAKDGVDQPVAELAEQIKAAQAPEIAQMQGWLAGWGASTSMEGHAGHSGMGGGDMGGMMSEEDLAALEQADGATATELFLTGMVAHHEGAVQMAEAELADGVNPDAQALARTIIETQRAEIATMQQLLAAR